MRRAWPGGRVRTVEKLGALWALLVTFALGLGLVLARQKTLDRSIVVMLFLFIEFVPMLSFIATVAIPVLSPMLLIPWILVNAILILFSSILVPTHVINTNTTESFLPTALLGVFIIFPVVSLAILGLPCLVFVRRKIPNYKKRIEKSELYRQVTGKKTAAEIEQEILERRKQQVRLEEIHFITPSDLF